MILIFLVQWLWFVGLAHQILNLTERGLMRVMKPFERLLLVSVSFGTAGYLVFWIYAVFPPLGWLLSLASFVIGIRGAYQFLRSTPRSAYLDTSKWAWSCGFLGILGLLYLSFVSIVHYQPANLLDWISNYYFELSNDNVIPRFAAEVVRAGESLIQPQAQWQTSDRTPLLSGIYLIFSFFTDTKTYQATGLIFQTLFFLSALQFLKQFQVRSKACFWILVALILSAFFHHSSVYLWPKLQSAHYVLLGLMLMTEATLTFLSEEQRWASAALCFVLAYLCHPGVIFCAPILLPFAVSHIGRLKRLNAKVLLPLVPTALMFGIWIFYQKVINPPGDRLLKWHLAGETEMNRIPLLKLLIQNYSRMTWQEIIAVRFQNLKYQFAIDHGITTFRAWRRSEFLHTFQAFGLWWIGLLGLPRLFAKNEIGEKAKKIAIGILAAQLIWIAMIFLPDATPNHHNSYATLSFIALLLWLGINELPRPICYMVTTLSSIYFLFVWVIATPIEFAWEASKLNLWDIPLSIGLLIVFISFLWKSLSREQEMAI